MDDNPYESPESGPNAGRRFGTRHFAALPIVLLLTAISTCCASPADPRAMYLIAPLLATVLLVAYGLGVWAGRGP